MTVTDIMTLAKAGFNANQIAALNSLTISPAPAPEQAQSNITGTEQQTAQATSAAQAPAGDQTAEILRQLGVISGQITTANINNTNQPTQQTADDILAAIIMPPKKEG